MLPGEADARVEVVHAGASSLRSPSRHPGLPGDGRGVSGRPFRYNGAEPM